MYSITPITRNLIILNVVIYLITNFFSTEYLYDILSAYFPFSPNFKSWQIVTHMFMHAPLGGGYGIMHIAFNMITLFSFGPVLERVLGDRKFLILYFLSGLGAFLLYNLYNYYEVYTVTKTLTEQGVDITKIYQLSDLTNTAQTEISIPQNSVEDATALRDALSTKMLGASGAIFGVVAAFSALFPDAKLFFMLIPFPIKAKYLFPIVIVVSVYLGFNNTGGIAHFAHVGGALVGYFLIRYWGRNRFRMNPYQ